jgi:hypothetical protein
MTEGRCLCGALRYQIDGPFVDMVHCHCSMCRKHHGTAFATWVAAPADGFRWLAPTDALVEYRWSERGHRAFCSVCGSVAPVVDPAIGLAIVPAGNIEGDPGVRPTRHMFTASKAPWYAIADGLPQHDEFPPEFGMTATTRTPVEATPGVVQGSCLCGDVAYEISSTPLRFFYCHCSRCRQGRSAAHCANLFYPAEGFRWMRGREQVREYRPPGAQYFAIAFCSRCGSGAPRISAERQVAVVPAGTLDTDPGMEPSGHIYVASKAAWFDIADTLPQFAEMPTRN